jgi:hypothetical protein
MKQKARSGISSDAIRRSAQQSYVRPARHRGLKRFSINVGEVHRALALQNRVPLVCQALGSEKFLEANSLKLVSKTGPPSGQSTTVTYTYEFLEKGTQANILEDPWPGLRGVFKHVFRELGGGEAYLRAEREKFEALKDS